MAQWGQEKYLIYLPLYVADARGFFASEGISVRLKFSGNDDQTFATVLAGEAVAGVGDPAFAAIATERGSEARVIATLVNGVAIWGVTNNSAIPLITKAEQLEGLRVGTFPEPSTNYTLMRRTVNATAALRRTTKIVQAPIGAQLALLEAGRADIAMELEPGASLAIQKGYRLVYSSPLFEGEFAFTGVTTTARNMETDSSALRSLVRGLDRAVRFCHTSPIECEQTARSLFPSLDSTVVSAAVARMLAERTLPPTVATSDKAWQAALSVRLAVGDLKRPQETGRVVDNRYILSAH